MSYSIDVDYEYAVKLHVSQDEYGQFGLTHDEIEAQLSAQIAAGVAAAREKTDREAALKLQSAFDNENYADYQYALRLQNGDDEQVLADSLLALQIQEDPGHDPRQNEQIAIDRELALRTLRQDEKTAITTAPMTSVLDTILNNRYTGLAPVLNADGTVSFGGACYTRKECGGSFAGDFNLCGFLSLTDGDGPAAIALKAKLAPVVRQLRPSQDADPGAQGVQASEVTFEAYAAVEKRPVWVCSLGPTHNIRVYNAGDNRGDTVYIYNDDAHYMRLHRI